VVITQHVQIPGYQTSSVIMPGPSGNDISSYKPVAQVYDMKPVDSDPTKLRNISWRTRLIPFCVSIPAFVSLAIVILHT
jgi:hypothetical protein